MCFKKPKPPQKTAEDIKAEKELEEMRKIRQAQLNEELRLSKERRTEDAIARAQGFFGNRSLLQGGKGGSGFLGANTRQRKPIIKRQDGPSVSPSAPPIMSIGGYTAPSGDTLSYWGGYGGGSGSLFNIV